MKRLPILLLAVVVRSAFASPQDAPSDIVVASASMSTSVAGSVAAIRAVAANPEPIPAVHATSPREPAGARHLDASMLQGRTLVFAHPMFPQRYGQVHLTFTDDHVDARTDAGKSFGYYKVVDDKLCVILTDPLWRQSCFYVVDGDVAQPGEVRMRFADSGNVAALRIE